jgi:membrane associated rhomboid family serine protease
VIPYKDDNPTVLTPVVTLGIIAVTSLVWLFLQGAGSEPRLSESVCQLGAIPAAIFGHPIEPVMTPRGPVMVCGPSAGGGWYTVVTSVFMHGSWFHILGNMWFFWVFGNNIEDAMGHARFAGFYLLCGVLAALGQILTDPSSPLPMVGASGAISGIMGAYLVLYPRVRVHTIVFLGFFFTSITLPAYFMLLFWVGVQLLGSLPSLAGGPSSGGVAFMAHVSGFVLGALLIKLFAKPDLLAAARRGSVMFTTRQPWRY